MKPYKPKPHQVALLETLKKSPRLAIWAPMGAGKTSVTLSHILHLRATAGQPVRVLIVAPKAVALNVWRQEAAEFNNFSSLTFDFIHGEAKEFIYLNSKANVFLINYDALEWLSGVIKRTKKLRFNVLIFDESSCMKASSTRRFKSFKAIPKLMINTYLLSATPAPNSALDLWTQYYLLDEGVSLGHTFGEFKAKYFREKGGTYKEYILQEGGWDRIVQDVKHLTYRLDSSELPVLAPLTHEKIFIELPVEAKEQYDQLEKEMLIQFDNLLIAINNAAVLQIKLRQLVQGFMYNNETSIPINDLKIQALGNLVDDLEGKPLIVAYNFKQELIRLQEYFGVGAIHLNTANKNSANIVQDWNNGLIPVLLCNPASVSHGLNLQKGGCNIAWLGLTYSLERYIQLVGRLHRNGQDSPVTNYLILAKNTIDEAVYASLQRKEGQQTLFMDALFKLKKQRGVTTNEQG